MADVSFLGSEFLTWLWFTTEKNGDRIEFVQDAIVLENLISKFLFSQAGKGSATDGQNSSSDQSTAPAQSAKPSNKE